jgi:hypothetical protein
MNIAYEWKHKGAWDLFEITAGLTAEEIQEGSEEEFITEHYWGYTQLGDRLTSGYQVEHPRWQVYPVKTHQMKIRFGELYGAAFSHLKDVPPDSIMLAEGSEIAVRVAARIK